MDADSTHWTWDRIVEKGREVVAAEGFLPPAKYFQDRGFATIVQNIYKLGRTWEDLRSELDAFENSAFVPSRSGIRWRSHPEASVSNFLFARGIRHARGRKYPPEYKMQSGKAYGYYDVLVWDENDQPVDIEIWGDKPNGHNEVGYAEVRRLKEKFNEGRTDFLGIAFQACYDELELARILEPYVGRVPPHVFVASHDALLNSTHWSNADEVIAACQQIATAQPEGKFPPEDWLRRRGQFADREGEPYHAVVHGITEFIGGFRRLRELLGQSENSTQKWDRESCLAALRDWYAKHGKSPGAFIAHARKYGGVSDDEVGTAGRLAAAVFKHVGSMVDACNAIGVAPSRRAPRRPA